MSKAGDWDRRYAEHEHLFAVEPDEALVELAGPLAAGAALDLGAGEGRNSLWLARRGWRVTAVDFSRVALARLAAQAATEDLPVVTVLADIERPAAREESFDLVVLANIHPVAERRAALLAAAARAVAPGGHLFLVGHHVDALGKAGPPDPARLYTEERLAGAFPGLEVRKLERRERPHGDTGEPSVDVVLWAARPRGGATRPA